MLPHTVSENSDGLMGNVPCLLNRAAECDPRAGSPSRVRWPMALSQACVSAGESKQYFSSMGVFCKPCKIPASTFALAQTCSPQNTTQRPLTPRCNHQELLASGSPSKHLGAAALQAWGQERKAGGAVGLAGLLVRTQPQSPLPAGGACRTHRSCSRNAATEIS